MENAILSWKDPEWPERTIDTIKLPARNDRPLRGEPWVSKSTGRRGLILWAINDKVKISFNEHEDGTVLNLTSFLDHYRKV